MTRQEDHEFEVTYTVKVRGYGKRTQVIKETMANLQGVLKISFLEDATVEFVRSKIIDADV